MVPPEYLIQPAKSLEEASAFWWPLIRDLGWNRSAADGPMHFHAALDGQSWLLITPEKEKTPQGCVVAFPYPNKTAWIGFFIMNESYRGQGLGGVLWRAMDKIWNLRGTEIIGLDGVQEQVKTYERRGFIDTARIPLMVGSAEDFRKAAYTPGSDNKDGIVKDIKTVDRSALAQLDQALTGLDRSVYWSTSNVLSRDDVFGYTYSALSSPASITGFVLVRGCEEGHRIGPLYAPSPAIAADLLYLTMQHPSIANSSGSLIAELFGPNTESKAVFKSLGWKEVGIEYHRMWYKGKVPTPQNEGGRGIKGMFAIFDAGCG